LRQLRDPHLAQEATQSAFIALAQKAGKLRPGTLVGGWLHRAVHFAALKQERTEARRKRWEEEAATMNVPGDKADIFQEAALPHVDSALAELSEPDRDAVILRFLEQLSFRDVAQTLGTSEDAAKKRVGRALERLRSLLVRRGIVISATALAAGLTQLPVTAAPRAWCSAPSSLAMNTAAGAGPISATILKSVTKTKFALAGIVVVAAVVAALLWLTRSRPTVATAANPTQSSMPKIKITSVMVDDQDKALNF